jgi:hypothetical protein
MVELWTSRGLDKNTATDVIEKISKYPAFFADIMMKVICAGFLCFGLVPLRSLRLYLLLLIFFSSSFPVCYSSG